MRGDGRSAPKGDQSTMSSVLSKGRVLGQSDRIRPGEGRPDKWVPPDGVGLRGNEFGQYSASGKHAPKKKEKKKDSLGQELCR